MLFSLWITAGDCGKVNEKFLVVNSPHKYISRHVLAKASSDYQSSNSQSEHI